VSDARRPRLNFLPPLALFLLAPLIGEFLLGNLPITWLWVLIVLAPLYGGGALLVREAAVRLGAGWPGIFLLGLAYGVIEEGLVDQSLFNPTYLGLRLLDYGYVPSLGIGLWWTVYVLGLHLIWSVAASIGLAEALWPERAREPWLGRVTLPLTVVIFLFGCAATFAAQPGTFVASPAQLALSVVVVLILVAAAALAGRRKAPPLVAGSQPSPFALGALALVALSLFLLASWAIGRVPASANAAFMLLDVAVLGGLILSWSRRQGWGSSHVLALVAGALATYGWWGFVQLPSVPGSTPAIDLIGNVVFAAGAAALLWLAWRRLPAA